MAASRAMRHGRALAFLLIGLAIAANVAAAAAPCPNDCSGRGRCLNGICVCDSTFAGADCSDHIDRNVPSDFPSLTGAVDAWRAENAEAGIEPPFVKLRVCLVTSEIAGPVSNGGIGTAFTTLAESLVDAGHDVTVLFTKGAISQFGPFEDHVRAYASKGITLVGLTRPGQRYIPRHLQVSFEVLLYLRAHAFDVVHLHDYEGAGYYPLLAKDQGEPELVSKFFVLGLHGPNLWAKAVGNMEAIDKIDDLELDFMERKCVAMADAVISPSTYLLQWMASEGWPLNGRSMSQPNMLPKARFGGPNDAQGSSDDGGGVGREGGEEAKGGETQPRPRRAIRELVFFGRIETRKGIVTFCDAIDRILSRAEELGVTVGAGGLEKVVFLGRSALVGGVYGMQYVQERGNRWQIPWKAISRLDSAEALEYLRGADRLAVMPSRIENSPYTIYECSQLGIPFLASTVGGIPDLLHPEDHAASLFEPNADALVAKLVDALRGGVASARPSVDAHANAATWLAWHQAIAHEHAATVRALALKREALDDAGDEALPFVSVIMTHFNRPDLVRQAIDSVRAQDYPQSRYELIVMDDGSTDANAKAKLAELESEFAQRNWTIVWGENCYLGCARNKALERAKGKYVLFMDDDNYAKPHEVSTFVRAMESSNADVLTSFVDFYWGLESPAPKSDRPSYIFLGGSADVGAFKNCFGDANCFVRVESFREIGGYTEDYGIGFEDWEMYANASLRGYKVDVVPDAVYHYRFTDGSMQKTTDFYKNRRRSLRPYLNSLPEELHDTILGAVFPRNADGTIAAPTGLAAQGTSRFPGVVRSDGELEVVPGGMKKQQRAGGGKSGL